MTDTGAGTMEANGGMQLDMSMNRDWHGGLRRFLVMAAGAWLAL